MMIPELQVLKLTSDLHSHVYMHAHLSTRDMTRERNRETNKKERKKEVFSFSKLLQIFKITSTYRKSGIS